MRLSLKWLQKFVDIELSAQEIADKLVMSGTEVERIEQIGEGLEHVIIGEVIKLAHHPHADNLKVASVAVGRGETPLQIVCGAPNIAEGQKVALVRAGNKLPDGREILKKEIRAVSSEGMLCFEEELGLGPDQSGIMVLPSDAPLGVTLMKYLDMYDTIFHLSITPNRPDCLSVLGLAREIAALVRAPLQETKVEVHEGDTKIENVLDVFLENTDECQMYCARVITGVRMRASPQWLKNYLSAAGVRSINAVVDITNYVMIELGAPLHAFDFDKLNGEGMKKLVVRRAQKGEKLTTLDGVERNLSEADLIMDDGKKVIDLLCVMGGDNTKIDDPTHTIVLQAPIADKVLIRKTSQRLGVRSEAEMRFERGIAPELPQKAIEKAAEMIEQICKGTALRGIIMHQRKMQENAPIEVQYSYVHKLLGREFAKQEIFEILQRLKFRVEESGAGAFLAVPPSFRLDISIPADVVEEIGRMYNYNNLEGDPLCGDLRPQKLDQHFENQRRVKSALVRLGFSEVYNYSFYSGKILGTAGFPRENHMRVRNPLNEDQEFLRVSLLPGLLKNIAHNLHEADDIRLFEVGRVFLAGKSGELPVQPTVCAAVWCVKKDAQSMLYRKHKGVFEEILSDLSLRDFVDFKVGPHGMNLFLKDQKEAIGMIEQLNTQLLQDFKIKHSAVYFELNVDMLAGFVAKRVSYEDLPKFPRMKRDMSFDFPLGAPDRGACVGYNEISAYFATLSSPVIRVQLIDEYVSASENKRSLAFRFIYGSPERTLENKEVEMREKKIIGEMKNCFNATLRGSGERIPERA